MSNNIKKHTSKRDANVDLMRLLACLIVIGVHVNGLSVTTLDKTRIFWGIFLGDGVTIFFMIMGFFLFKNKSFKKLLKKTCIHIILPSAILMLVAELLYPWTSNSIPFSECIKNLKLDYNSIIKSVLSWSPPGISGHLWYIFTYIKIILMFPILRWIVKDENTSKYVIFLTLGLMIYTDLKNFFQPLYQFTPFYLIEIAMMYPILGYEIYKRKDSIKNNHKLAIIAILISIVTQVIRYVMQYKLFEQDITNNRFFYWNTSFACISIASIIIAILSLEIKNKYISNVVSFLGQRTFVIYLVHSMVILFLETRNLSVNVLKFLGYTLETSGYMTFAQEFAYFAIKITVIFSISLLITCILYLIKILINKSVEKIKLITENK